MQMHEAFKSKALITFVTAGDPPIGQLPAILQTMEEGGADVIEIGIPFSDPIADGPTIQASSQRALDNGVTVTAIFEAVAFADVRAPIVFMGYTNTAMRIGFSEFAARCKDCGAAGVILSDMAPDDSEEWRAAASRSGIETIFLAAPTSTDERIECVTRVSSGFVYCVSRTGVTGAGSVVPPEVVDTVRRIKSHTALPVCVGFGISKPEHVRMVCEVADGAVVGSSIVDLLHREWNDGAGRDTLMQYISALKAATNG